MKRTNAFVFAAVAALACAGVAEAQRGGDAADMFNTVKTKAGQWAAGCRRDRQYARSRYLLRDG